jgi:hypothetical protein
MANSINNKPEDGVEKKTGNTISRKNFFKYAGASMVGAAAVGLYGCGDDDDPVGPPMEDAVNLGSGDVGILNLAFALEQLEAAFYLRATSDNSWMQSGDQSVFADIRDHEIAHRDWFSAVIESQAGAEARIPGLTPYFEEIDFSSRSNVLNIAVALEDTGVGAYNGAGQFISMTDAGAIYLLQAGKIVSVEARHAAAVRDLRDGGTSFAGDDIVDEDGLDTVLSVQAAVEAASPFIEEELDFSSVGQ